VSLHRQTDALIEPVTTDELKSYLRVEHNEDDEFIASLGVAARDYVERATNLILAESTWLYKLKNFPLSDLSITLPLYPATDVESITYRLADGTEKDFDDYHLADNRIILDYGCSFPSDILDDGEPVAITFTAGYGEDECPEMAKQAIKYIVALWYENRISIDRAKNFELPYTANALITMVKERIV
jgi:uncharacterized phiE125 gp8 family phage protein